MMDQIPLHQCREKIKQAENKIKDILDDLEKETTLQVIDLKFTPVKKGNGLTKVTGFSPSEDSKAIILENIDVKIKTEL